MNILILSPNVPSPHSGASTRNYQVLKMLAAKHNCSLLAFQPNAADKESVIAAIGQLVSSVHLIPKSEPAKRRQQFVSTLCGISYILQSYYRSELNEYIIAFVTFVSYYVSFFNSVI